MSRMAEVTAALDHFYFGEVAAVMHPSLRTLAADMRLLQGHDDARIITTLTDLYNSSYQYLPYLLNDLFDVPDDTLLQIEKGWMLLLIAYVMLDEIVDRQMPDIPAAPLVQQHLLLKAHEVFRAVFPAGDAFWRSYDALLHEFFTCLALESHYLDADAAPYTYQRMQEVCTGKAAPLQIVATALAAVSGKPERAVLIRQVFDRLVFSDQLFDDAADWEDDLTAGRRTLPYVMAQQAAGEAITDRELLKQVVTNRGILATMTDQAVGLLDEGRALLDSAGLAETQLYEVLGSRAERIRADGRQYKAAAFLGGLVTLLEKR